MCLKKIGLLLTIFYLFIVIEGVLQPEDEEFLGFHTADTFNWTHHPCRRECHAGQQPAECYYVFVVEKYSSMSKACYDCPFNKSDCFRPHCIPTDGVQKSLYVVNRQMPGPVIQVCENDIIIVEVRNRMSAESTTIHWHGFNQKGTPYMDGVPYVTQCPILPGETFEYTFRANEPGTYFWHSHIGSQRADGMFGAMIICPLQERFINLYDVDIHRMVINDWIQRDGETVFIREYHQETGNDPTTILVNGMGRFLRLQRGSESIFTPVAVFGVRSGERHRFRMISAGAEDCPIEMSIDNHVLIVISLDSNDIQPVQVDSITIWPGERVDFVVVANQKPDNYWIRYRGYGLCQDTNNTNVGAHQVAILRYTDPGVPRSNPTSRIAYNIPVQNNQTRVLNPYQRGTESSPRTNINVPLLNAAVMDDISLKPIPDEIVYISFDFYPRNNYDFHRKNLYGLQQVNNTHPTRVINSFQLNNITLKMLPFPLLSQRDELLDSDFCNEKKLPSNCYPEQCACTHVISLPLNAVVELVFVDEGRYAVINHPLHLHGHFFRVVATENLEGAVSVERVKALMQEGRVRRKLSRAPLKDTIKAPGGGYTIVRFFADNPGYWFFHCHFEQHMNVGMALVFKVGEHGQMPPVPKGFPKCGNYAPYSSTWKRRQRIP